jgi:transposase
VDDTATVTCWVVQPRSIVVLNNAKIHMYKALQDAISARGAILIFLPPYSPQLNPIEVGFSLLKRWIQRNGNRIFHDTPEEVLDTAFLCCASKSNLAMNLYSHCGYLSNGELSIEPFTSTEF